MATRTIYISPSGTRQTVRPRSVVIGKHRLFNPSDDSLTRAGWTQVKEEVPAPSYEERVVALIRERYSVNDELALLRQRDSKPEEFAAYNAWCEACKERVKDELQEAI